LKEIFFSKNINKISRKKFFQGFAKKNEKSWKIPNPEFSRLHNLLQIFSNFQIDYFGVFFLKKNFRKFQGKDLNQTFLPMRQTSLFEA